MSEPSPHAPVAIELTLPWGPTVRGQRLGHGRDRVLLLHEPGVDLDAWLSLPLAIAQALPVEVIVLDLPGHGLSDGLWEAERTAELVASLVNHGPPEGRRLLIAAGEVAFEALNTAATLKLAGLVGLSPRGPDQTCARSPRVSKLLFAGSLAGNDLDRARRLASAAGGWAVVTAVPVAAQGTGLLQTRWCGRIAEQITTFIGDCLRSPLS